MTNADYIRSRLTDRDLCSLFIERRMFYEEGFLSEIKKVYGCWASFDFTCNGNVKEIGGITPSIWEWRKTYDEETKEWKTTGRTQEISFSVWLFEKYNERYWKEAIQKYNERYHIIE